MTFTYKTKCQPKAEPVRAPVEGSGKRLQEKMQRLGLPAIWKEKRFWTEKPVNMWLGGNGVQVHEVEKC